MIFQFKTINHQSIPCQDITGNDWYFHWSLPYSEQFTFPASQCALQQPTFTVESKSSHIGIVVVVVHIVPEADVAAEILRHRRVEDPCGDGSHTHDQQTLRQHSGWRCNNLENILLELLGTESMCCSPNFRWGKQHSAQWNSSSVIMILPKQLCRACFFPVMITTLHLSRKSLIEGSQGTDR